MIISPQFQKKIFGDFVKDLFDNNSFLKIPFLQWEDGSEVIITKYNDYYDSDMLRWYLKIFDIKYPKKDDGEPYSFRDVDSKTLTDHLEYYRLVLAHNSKSFKSDLEEWDRMIEKYNR